MGRLWLSAGLLLTLFSLTLWNTHYLGRCTEEMTLLLLQAEICAADGDWDAAGDKTEAAFYHWNKHETYLHMILPHQDNDEVLLSFQDVRRQIAYQEDLGEYAAANARLVARIGLLYEMEQLSWKNLI